ncbi:hypothetical protein DF3PB_470005 [uncultured Defluviicoccus sp.]|uniref:Uncharacterized protein n=1 Tax=metagenome TaxID=256318 RepID=A0A380TIX9_9ZZZZ|nr:hypothetical protein DF3PB_470005 [uncultured Defluviicoccus sp.]
MGVFFNRSQGIAYDSVCDYIRRATQATPTAPAFATTGSEQASLDLTGK